MSTIVRLALDPRLDEPGLRQVTIGVTNYGREPTPSRVSRPGPAR